MTINAKRSHQRFPIAAAGVLCGSTMLLGGTAHAFNFELTDDLTGSLDTSVTIGGAWRMQDRDRGIIGKLNIEGQQGICSPDSGDPGDPVQNPTATNGNGMPRAGIADTRYGCLSSNAEYLAAPGFSSSSGDDSTLNYDQWDVVNAALKVSSDLTLEWGDWGVKLRATYHFDNAQTNFTNKHPNAVFRDPARNGPTTSPRRKIVEDELGSNFEVLDSYIFGGFEIGDRFLSIKVGNQVISWGESTFLVLNSINTVNPPDAQRLRLPGSDLKEVFIPVGMALVGFDLTESLSLEAFYQYDWKRIRPDPVGSFYASSDVGGIGGEYASLSFGKAPEDPSNFADELTTQGASCLAQDGRPVAGNATATPLAAALNTAGITGNNLNRLYADGQDGRTICLLGQNTPRDDNQYGISLKYYAEDFNNGTEFGFFFMNYHSRLPYASAFSATPVLDLGAGDEYVGPAVYFDSAGNERRRIVPGDSIANRENTPGATTGEAFDANGNAISNAPEVGGTQTPGTDDDSNLGTVIDVLVNGQPFVDTVRLQLEYPEDIQLYGLSFNTTIGDWALQGEIAYRPNLPLQIQAAQVVARAEAPAFGGARHFALPNQIESYRNEDVSVVAGTLESAGRYIRGFERFPVAQYGMTATWAAGANNPFGAEQWIVLIEAGATQVFGMPSVDELALEAPGLEFLGGQRDNNASANGTVQNNNFGAFYDEVAADSEFGACPLILLDANAGAVPAAQALAADTGVPTCIVASPSRQREGFPTAFSWGYRAVTLLEYPSLFWGWNIQPLAGFFHDVNGTTPGPGGNFIENRKLILAGIRGSWRSRYDMELRYTWFTGAKQFNQERDKDNFFLTFKYQF